jgi:hypothetical protein
MKQTAVEQLVQEINKLTGLNIAMDEPCVIQAKEVEKQRHKKFNDFLQEEIELGISDKATIERIEWYYNTYFINNEQQ